MTKIDMLNREGSSVGEIELNDAIFMNQINVPIMHQAVRVYLASLRRGTHSTKNRAAVSGGGKKAPVAPASVPRVTRYGVAAAWLLALHPAIIPLLCRKKCVELLCFLH